MIGSGRSDATYDVGGEPQLYRFARDQSNSNSRFDELVAIIEGKKAYQEGMLGVHFDEHSITFNHTLKEISAIVPELFMMMFQKNKLKQISISEEYFFDPKFIDKNAAYRRKDTKFLFINCKLTCLRNWKESEIKKSKLIP